MLGTSSTPTSGDDKNGLNTNILELIEDVGIRGMMKGWSDLNIIIEKVVQCKTQAEKKKCYTLLLQLDHAIIYFLERLCLPYYRDNESNFTSTQAIR